MRVFGLTTALAVLSLASCSCQEPTSGAPCDTTDDCLANEICVQGFCRRPCNSNASCQRDEICINGACMPFVDGGAADSARRDAAADAAAGDLRRDAGGGDLGPAD
ncbi:MAG: hypothetical protein JXR83_17890, partial [Deltaproteobacteria bacterium]|nr:hypothetical protein [Deltaproteobacteria bacterium]